MTLKDIVGKNWLTIITMYWYLLKNNSLYYSKDSFMNFHDKCHLGWRYELRNREPTADAHTTTGDS